jgi:hypothetical protein
VCLRQGLLLDLPFGVDFFFRAVRIHVVVLVLVIHAPASLMHHWMIQSVGNGRHGRHRVTQGHALHSYELGRRHLSSMRVNVTAKARTWRRVGDLGVAASLVVCLGVLLHFHFF